MEKRRENWEKLICELVHVEAIMRLTIPKDRDNGIFQKSNKYGCKRRWG